MYHNTLPPLHPYTPSPLPPVLPPEPPRNRRKLTLIIIICASVLFVLCCVAVSVGIYVNNNPPSTSNSVDSQPPPSNTPPTSPDSGKKEEEDVAKPETAPNENSDSNPDEVESTVQPRDNRPAPEPDPPNDHPDNHEGHSITVDTTVDIVIPRTPHPIDDTLIEIIESNPAPPPAPTPTPIDEGADADDFYPEISEDIKVLARQVGLTEAAKHIFYGTEPVILDLDATAEACGLPDGELGSVILGCWKVKEDGSGGNIFIARTPEIKDTVAHELLHAIYHNLYGFSVPDGLSREIDIVVNQQPEEAARVLRAYDLDNAPYSEDTKRLIKYNELHSFIGTQFNNLPSSLEAHYAKYFNNRRGLVGEYTSRVQKSLARSTLKERFDGQHAEYRKCRAENSRSVCAQYDLYEEYKAFQDCLLDDSTLFSACQQLTPPPLRVYNP